MSHQIAVRLPDELVEQVDRLIADGGARSRAEVVVRALRRELRRQRALDELDRLPAADDDLAELAAWASAHPSGA